MHVLFLIDTLQTGGAEKSLLDILSRFKRYKPVVCHIYPGNSLKNEFERRGIPVISLDVQGKKNYAQAIQMLMPVVEKYKPVLIHATLYRSEIISRRLKTLVKVPLVNSFVNNRYTPDRYAQVSLPGKFALFFYQLCDRFSAGRADLFFSNSRSIMLNNAAALKVPAGKIKIIPRGRDMNVFGGAPAITDGTPGKNITILTVGRLLGSKGHGDLLRAFAGLHEEFPDVTLNIAGEGPNRKTLEDLISSLGLASKVTLMGNRTDVPQLLMSSDLFVFPSHYEGLPGALIEAMMAGKVIIASDIAENLECIDEKTALIYKKGDVTALTSLIRKVLQSPRQFSGLATAAREKAKHQFDIEAVAAEYEKTYDEILNAKR